MPRRPKEEISVDKEQFYPTPKKLATQLIQMLKKPCGGLVLEPSAGTGALLDTFRELQRFHTYSYHCIEPDKIRRATLQGKDYTVVWDDFLTFDPVTPYSLILMNPPFFQGAKHLMKALQICAPNGQIVCILNAETLKNPCTNVRKALLRELERQEAYEIQFVQNAFSAAEHPTSVEVALIYVRKKAATESCITFEHFKRKTVRIHEKDSLDNSVAQYGEIPQLIDIYRAEVKSALALYKEFLAFERISLKGQKEYSHGVFELKINSVGDNAADDYEKILRKINYKYWYVLLYSKELSRLLTNKVQQEYASRLTEMSRYEFNERNILQMKEDLSCNLLQNIEDAIMNVWEEFTHRYSYAEYGNNIHYYNGWKTNRAFACNKKIILPLYAYSSWAGRFEPTYSVSGALSDIEKVMNYLDCGRTEAADMSMQLKMAEQAGKNRNIDTKYFTVTLYKKGTCHLVFKDLDLLKKFNLYAGRKFKWLPDDYGRKPYKHLNLEEKSIVDSFEGQESYEETYRNQDFFLPQANSLLLLDAGQTA